MYGKPIEILPCFLCKHRPVLQKVVWEKEHIELTIQHRRRSCPLEIRMPPVNREYRTMKVLMNRWNKLQRRLNTLGGEENV